MVWTLIIILLVIVDQGTKTAVRYLISPQDSIPVIQGFFYIIYRVNPGAAWSIFSNRAWGIYLLAFISLVASIVILYMIQSVTYQRTKLALALIGSGSIGNLIDRLLFKGVTDFLDFHFGNYVFPTFNIADTLIVCGSIFLIIAMAADRNIFNDLTFTTSHAETEEKN